MPTVDCVIASRNRAWILPKWLESLESQTHPIRRIIVLDNSSPSETEQTDWLVDMEKARRLSYVPFPSWEDEPWERGSYTKENFARITNKAFDVFLNGVSDYLFFFDTDQTCGPDAVERLLDLDEPTAGLVIRTSPNAGIYNFLGTADVCEPGKPCYDRNSLKRREDIFKPVYPKFAPTGPFRVGFVSGAVLLRRAIVHMVRASKTHPNWEWGSVWDEVRRRRIPGPMIEPRVETAHYMKQGDPPLVYKPS